MNPEMHLFLVSSGGATLGALETRQVIVGVRDRGGRLLPKLLPTDAAHRGGAKLVHDKRMLQNIYNNLRRSHIFIEVSLAVELLVSRIDYGYTSNALSVE